MADPIPENVPSTSDWAASVAGKKVAWGMGKVIAALIASPVGSHAFQSFSSALQPLGITFIVDPTILSNALPPIVFGGLVLAHDWLKLRFPNITWL